MEYKNNNSNKTIKPTVELCMRCKGRMWCSLPSCPFYSKLNSLNYASKKITKLQNDFNSLSNDVFVSRMDYPNISFGILSPIDKDKKSFLSPKEMNKQEYDISKIISIRSKIINSRKPTGTKPNQKLIEKGQELSLSKKEVDVEINLKSKPYFKLDLNVTSAPTGAYGKLKKMNIVSNPKIPKITDEIMNDKYIKAKQGMHMLYEKGFDENYIRKFISVGASGIEKNRKLVPTRWAITATDDILGKKNIEEIKKYDEIDSFLLFTGDYLGNYYYIILFPEKWSYELFEVYLPKASWNFGEKLEWMSDYEKYSGRKNYAENTVGGYYAVRLSISEYLKKIKKQATVIALRIITDEYYAPLGVWVVREASRNAMKGIQNKPIEFETKKQLLDYLKSILSKRFKIHPNETKRLYSKSILMKEMKNQKKITQFF